MSDILWQPTTEQIDQSQMMAFMKMAHDKCGVTLTSYDDLYQWSVSDPHEFWRTCWQFTGVIGEMGHRILTEEDQMPGATFFPDATLNYAENLLRRRDNAIAIYACSEDGSKSTLSFSELRSQVAKFQSALIRMGVKKGDRVAAIVSNTAESIIALLSVSSLGAIWSSCSPDFGADGILDRFGQIEPVVLITVADCSYKGKAIDLSNKIRSVTNGLPSVKNVIVIHQTELAPDLSDLTGSVNWCTCLEESDSTDPVFPKLPFNHPLYILYSSGTTGMPKCIVHGAGGTLLTHLKEQQLHTDLRQDDVLFYFTTTGWMMWNWLASGLSTGCPIVLFEGSPFFPNPHVLIDLIDQLKITVFGTSAKYIDALKNAGIQPSRTHSLNSLRAILSTGSPLVPEAFDYVYSAFKNDLMLSSISGGTDIVSCFVLGCPIRPVRRGEIQCRGLGLPIEVFDDNGVPVIEQPGELVCTGPIPCMPLGFFNDEDGSRYHQAYFDMFPGIWRHGDWALHTENDGMIIFGRSDATLNPGGVRIGTAEIYRQVEYFEEVAEALVVGQRIDSDQRIVLFVRLATEHDLTPDLIQKIKLRIRQNTSPRHVPSVICSVTDIPRTRSGKICELAVRDVLEGKPVPNTAAMANPEALEQFRDRSELMVS